MPREKKSKPGQKSQNDKFQNDIKPEDLFEHYDTPAYDELRKLLKNVKSEYDKKISVKLPNGMIELYTPRWAFNRMLAHPIQDRGHSFDYTDFLKLVYPKIKLVADEIGRLEQAQGRDFPSLP